MAFWSGEKLTAHANVLFAPPDPKKVDCSAYRLALGPEVFVTTDQRFDDSPERGLKLYLDPGNQCRIPPGQFAFLLTEEVVTIPANAMAFISIRAKYKFKGLVNVSGFHVDPGWKGRLIFAVYNAGPSPVVLSRGAEMFLIWLVDLDCTSASVKTVAAPQMTIPDELTEGMSGQVFSPIALSKDVIELRERASEVRDEFSDKHSSLLVDVAQLKTDYSFYKKLVIGASLAVLGLIVREFYLHYSKRHETLTPTTVEYTKSPKAAVPGGMSVTTPQPSPRPLAGEEMGPVQARPPSISEKSQTPNTKKDTTVRKNE
jgi:dCTP deaminase